MTRDNSSEADSRLRGSRGHAQLFWGGLSQGASSLTNFGLSLLAARVLGPSGLGAVFLGFSIYVALVGFQRALLTDPLVAVSASLEDKDQDEAQSSALTVLILAATAASMLTLGVGLLIGGSIGSGLVVIAPWVLPCLLQDFWRVALFQRRRGIAGSVNDLGWVVAMAAAIPLALQVRQMWAVVATWGLGALAAAVLGFAQTRITPARLSKSLRWWRQDTWTMGRWLGLESLVHTVATRGLVFVLAFLLGTAPLGGLRAVQSIYAPMTLIGSAIALPALPEVTRRLRTSVALARKYVLLIGALAGALVAVYIGFAILGGSDLLALVFGEDFSGFEDLVWPVGTVQLTAAAFVGFPILLKGMQRSRELLVTTMVGSVVTFAAAVVGAVEAGILGAAWGMALGAMVRSGMNVYFSTRSG